MKNMRKMKQKITKLQDISRHLRSFGVMPIESLELELQSTPVLGSNFQVGLRKNAFGAGTFRFFEREGRFASFCGVCVLPI